MFILNLGSAHTIEPRVLPEWLNWFLATFFFTHFCTELHQHDVKMTLDLIFRLKRKSSACTGVRKCGTCTDGLKSSRCSLCYVGYLNASYVIQRDVISVDTGKSFSGEAIQQYSTDISTLLNIYQGPRMVLE